MVYKIILVRNNKSGIEDFLFLNSKFLKAHFSVYGDPLEIKSAIGGTNEKAREIFGKSNQIFDEGAYDIRLFNGSTLKIKSGDDIESITEQNILVQNIFNPLVEGMKNGMAYISLGLWIYPKNSDRTSAFGHSKYSFVNPANYIFYTQGEKENEIWDNFHLNEQEMLLRYALLDNIDSLGFLIRTAYGDTPDFSKKEQH